MTVQPRHVADGSTTGKGAEVGDRNAQRPDGGAGNEIRRALLLVIALAVLVLVAGYLFVSYL
jgi:hypothetical protein